MPVTIATFLERLGECRILDDAGLAAVRAKATSEDEAGDATPFVKRLHKEGDLTAYQAQALWKGRHAKLSLGNYVVEDELGRGGMGVVLRARHRRMKRLVAIKVLPEQFTKDADAVARFQREVEAAAQLEHTNIVTAHDADEVDGQHILVMQLVDGRDLSTVVKDRGPLSVAQAIDCVVQAARGLQFAHERGVIHRDIKPANLLLDSEGTVKILDMGLARFSDAAEVGTQAELTGTGTIMGTVDYMSPEQAMSTKSADARSDVYSLGITLFYLLTGRPAYSGDTLMARMMAHAQHPIPRIEEARPGVDESLQQLFEKMVAKSADERYQSMGDVIADLEACRDGSAGTAVVAKAPVTGGDSSGGLSRILVDESESIVGDVTSITGGVATRKRAKKKRRQVAAEEATFIGGTDSETAHSLPELRRRKSRKKKGRGVDWRVLAGGAAGGAVLLALVVFLFRTPTGTLRVEIDDPEIEVSVKGTNVVLKGADEQEVTLSPGDHVLHVQRGDFAFDTKSLTLKKGETVVVKVVLLDGEVQVSANGSAIGSADAPGAGPPTVVAGNPDATPPKPPKVTPDDGMVNIAGLVDVRRDLVQGEVEPIGNEGLRFLGTTKGHTRVTFPVEIVGSYRLRYEIVVEKGTYDTIFIFPVAGSQAEIDYGSHNNNRSGLGMIDGKMHDGNETTRRHMGFVPGEKFLLTIEVRASDKDARVRAVIDGGPYEEVVFVNWFGPVEKLSVPPSRAMVNGKGLALETVRDMRFESIGLEMIEGEAKLQRPNDVSKLTPLVDEKETEAAADEAMP